MIGAIVQRDGRFGYAETIMRGWAPKAKTEYFAVSNCVPIGEGPVNSESSTRTTPTPRPAPPALALDGMALAIPLIVEHGGTLVVPVTINGQITLGFLVDSGASDVSIPVDVFMTLVRTETITSSDFLGSQTYQLADGTNLPSQRFVIRSLKVGNKVLENVTGSIAPVAGSLLLGQSFLSRFKSWSIDNERQVLILN